ncbi:hypothetical protein ERJ75_001175000 [Trypanosoma vivax]|nr:hypothetical protein ERJ75_001175000 [Trypanosoma vivax]
MADWCVQNGVAIANAGLATRRRASTAVLSSAGITLCRDCEISNWKSWLGPDSDHYWITFDAFAGNSLDVIAASKTARAPHTWNRARWNEFRKLSDEFIFRRMKRSTKGADVLKRAIEQSADAKVERRKTVDLCVLTGGNEWARSIV